MLMLNYANFSLNSETPDLKIAQSLNFYSIDSTINSIHAIGESVSPCERLDVILEELP